MTIPIKEKMDIYTLHDTLQKMGVTIGIDTIRKYTTQYKVARRPKVTSLGRGYGTKSEYSSISLGHIYAAWKLLNGPIQTKLDNLRPIICTAVKLRKKLEVPIKDSLLSTLRANANDTAYLLELWINYFEESCQNYTKYRVNIEYNDNQRFFILVPQKMQRKRPRHFKFQEE